MDIHQTPEPVAPDRLPSAVRTFLAAHAARDVATAIDSFTPTATVTDEGRTRRGTAEVLEFLRTAGGEFTYTTTLLGAERLDDDHWVAVNRLEGDFPGGTAVLRYAFRLAGGLVDELVIGP